MSVFKSLFSPIAIGKFSQNPGFFFDEIRKLVQNQKTLSLVFFLKRAKRD